MIFASCRIVFDAAAVRLNALPRALTHWTELPRSANMVAMTVVDQRSSVPQLDAAARQRLIQALDREHVIAAYLFGSHARGSAGPLSDFDIAVLHVPGITPSDAFALRLDLASAAGKALATGEVDVVLVNNASPLLRHRVIRDGILLLDNDSPTRIAFQANALRDYLDTQSLRDELRSGLRHRLAENRFGRR
jgi:predicted nucleotidyltransferase